MDQPSRPTPEDSPLNDAQTSIRQEKPFPGPDYDPSTLATMPASPIPTNYTNVSSPTLAVLGRRYDVLGEAGRGAMGQVYKARDRETGEIVALKVLKPEIASDPGMAERFKSELLFARKITHKNVCRVYEFNRVDGIAYTSMEFVEGESLRSVLKRFGSLTPRKAIDLALQMCSGLKEAHAQGIVHRDLKPENVMIDTQGNVKVMDFGIARSMEAMTLLTGSMVGTPAYMAPEQAAGRAVDYRADIYALGLMLYEMFTGTQAFQAENAVALAMKHLQEPPRPPREIEPSISNSIENAILKCLEKAPENRFQSISELEATLRSELPASAGDRSTIVSATRTSNVTVPTTVTAAFPTGVATATPVPSAAPVQKTSRAGLVVAILVVALVVLGAGILWRGRASLDVSETVGPVSKDSSSSVPSVPVAATPGSISVATNEPAKPETPEVPKPDKITASPHADASASSKPAPPAPPASKPVHATANEARLAAAEAVPTSSAAASASSENTSTVPGALAPPGAKGGGGYVFVNRFPRPIGAQNAAKKIEEMGLPVTVIPKHNSVTDSEFFVVLTGPYSAEKVDGIVAKLKANGFPMAKLNRPMAGGMNSGPRSNSGPVP